LILRWILRYLKGDGKAAFFYFLAQNGVLMHVEEFNRLLAELTLTTLEIGVEQFLLLEDQVVTDISNISITD